MEWLVEQSGNPDSDTFSLNQLRRLLPAEEEKDKATSSETDNHRNFQRLGAAVLNQGKREVDLQEDEEEGNSSSEGESEDDEKVVEEEESTGDEDTGCFEDETFRRRCSETRVEVGCSFSAPPTTRGRKLNVICTEFCCRFNCPLAIWLFKRLESTSHCQLSASSCR